MKISNRVVFWATNLIIVLMVALMIAVYLRLFRLHLLFEDFYLHHWFTIIGTGFIAVYVPAYYFLKRRGGSTVSVLLNVHVLGNLLGASLISAHVVQELTRPPQSFPELGTGVVLISTMFLLVASGYLLRFRNLGLFKQLRYIHTALTLAFYLIIVVHVLHGINLI